MKIFSRKTALRIAVLLVALVGLCHAARAQTATRAVSFDYVKESDTKIVEFDAGLSVVITGVNRLDYSYKPTLAAISPGPGAIQPGAMRFVTVAEEEKTPEQKCADLVNKALEKRTATYGQTDLDAWWKDLRENILGQGTSCAKVADLSGKVDAELSRLADIKDTGTFVIDPKSLADQLLATGPGGGLAITFKADAFVTVVEISAGGATVTAKKGDADAASLSDAQKSHRKDRTFTVRFGPPPGILVSFGPYLSGLHRTVLDRTVDPSDASKLQISKNEDSNYSYGIAAFWTAKVMTKCFFGARMCGVSWGVAYNAQSDNALAGVLALGVRPTDSPLLLHFGVAVGRVTRLKAGFSPGGPVTATQDIPTKTTTTVRWSFSVSFATNAPR